MNPDERLADVFEKALRDGVESLAPAERDMYRIQHFILEYEIGGLSGYFYNTLPDVDEIRAAVTAMRCQGLRQLADLVNDAAELFRDYKEPATQLAWNDILRLYDPANHLNALENGINALDNYGLSGSSIVRAM